MRNRRRNRCRAEFVRCGMLAAAIVLSAGLDSAVSAPREPEKPAPTAQPDLFGARNWQRNVDHAHTEARRLGMPLLVISGNLPKPVVGTVDGSEIFDHPLIAELAESYFIPVTLASGGGADANRSVNTYTRGTSFGAAIRVVSPHGKDLVPQRETDFSARDLVLPLISALRQMDIEPPLYLFIIREEAMCHVRGVQRATFGMHCFWDGEVALGAIPGVVRTTPGLIGKREVVDLRFDPMLTSYEKLITLARSLKSASTVFAWDSDQLATARRLVGNATIRMDGTIRSADGSKHHLAQTSLKYVPMTHLQAIRINAALANKKDSKNLLSPRQLTLLALIEEHAEAGWPDCIDVDIRTAWPRAMQVAGQVTSK